MAQLKPTIQNDHFHSDSLKNSILGCISELGTVVLKDMSKVERVDTDDITPHLHEQLMLFVYRLVFLRIAETKGLWNSDEPSLVSLHRSDNGWQLLLERFQTLWFGDKENDILPIGSDLWEPSRCSLVTQTRFSNAQFRNVLGYLINEQSPVNWTEITTQELSLAFESVLELVPIVCLKSRTYMLTIKKGNTRKSSGSYYTPIELVDRVLKSTLVPSIEALEKLSDDAKEAALLDLSVCDPSCGSGNFLVASARVLANRLTALRIKDELDRKKVYQKALRDVLERCIYGVDLNPLTVEICKIVLWLELGIPNQTFEIFNHVQCGNALLGATPDLIEQGIKTEYFELILPHDDRKIRNAIAKTNRLQLKESEARGSLVDATTSEMSGLLADAFCAALVWPKVKGWEIAPTHTVFERIRNGVVAPSLRKNIQRLKNRFRFFHWHLVFPEVFSRGGFDVVIGNPPYLASRYLTKHQPYQRRAIPRLYRTASGNWDIYIPFTELGVRILKEGGYQAYVTPNKIIGAEYATVLHEQVFFSKTMLEVHDYSRLNLFDGANVAVVIVVNRKQPHPPNHMVQFYHYSNTVTQVSKQIQATTQSLQRLPKGFISFPVTTPDPDLMTWTELPITVSGVAEVSDGLSTDQAYKITKYVTEGNNELMVDLSVIKLVNTGTIDPFHLQWGEKKIKFLGFEGKYPIVDRAVLQDKFPKRCREVSAVTVGIAGLSTKLEAAILPNGVLSGVATVLLKPQPYVCPYALTAILNTELFSNLYKGLFGMSGMTADVLNYSVRQIAQLPVPNRKFLCPFIGSVDGIHLQHVDEIQLTDGLLSMLGQYGHRYSAAVHDAHFQRLIEACTLRALKDSRIQS